MIDFVTYCDSKGLALPTVDENTKRSGQRPQYPEGYYRNQYPDAAMAPHSATSFLDLKNSKKIRERKG
jgi:hypothetical protein